MINTLFGSGNSLGKCRLHGASRINRARRGRCSSSSREERRVVIIPRETGHPDSSANCRWFFFFFFLSFFLSPPGCANTERISKGKDSRRIRGGIISLSPSLGKFILAQSNRLLIQRISPQCIRSILIPSSTFARYFSPSSLSLTSFHPRECSLLSRFNRIATENFYIIPSVVFAEESDGTRETDLARLEKNFEKDETNSNAN